MPTKTSAPKKLNRSATKAKTSKPATKKKKPIKPSSDPSEERFVRDVLIRGEAAESLPDDELPSGVTHRIVDDGEDGDLPQLERERFSLY